MRWTRLTSIGLVAAAAAIPITADAKAGRSGDALGKAAFQMGGGPFRNGVPRGIWVAHGHVPPNAGHGHFWRGHFWRGHGWGHHHHHGGHPNSP